MFVLVNPQISTRTSAILALGALEYRDAWLAVSPGPGPVVSSFPLAEVEIVLGSQVVDQPSSSQAPTQLRVASPREGPSRGAGI